MSLNPHLSLTWITVSLKSCVKRRVKSEAYSDGFRFVASYLHPVWSGLHVLACSARVSMWKR